MKTFLTTLSALLLIVGSSQRGVALDLSSPPAGGIYDPAGVLNEEFEQVIRQRLSYEESFRQFEIFLLLLPDEPSQPIEQLAAEAGRSWSHGEFWSVIYQVGPDGDPDCVVGGNLMKQLPDKTVKQALLNARNTALMTSTPQNRLEDFANRIAEEFGFLNQLAQKNFNEAAAENQEFLRQKEKQKDLAKVAAIILSLMALALLVLAIWLWKKAGQKFLPQTFPLTDARKRLGGPATGGGDVLVKFGK